MSIRDMLFVRNLFTLFFMNMLISDVFLRNMFISKTCWLEPTLAYRTLCSITDMCLFKTICFEPTQASWTLGLLIPPMLSSVVRFHSSFTSIFFETDQAEKLSCLRIFSTEIGPFWNIKKTLLVNINLNVSWSSFSSIIWS